MLVALTVFGSMRLRDSRLGRAWIAIREDEVAAAAMGIPLMRTKTWAYATGAFFGGVAGAFYAELQERRVPGRLLLPDLGLHPLHGHPRRHGQHLGRDLRRVLPRLPRPEGLSNVGAWINAHLSARTSTCRCTSSGIYGAIIVLVMLFRPEGLIPSSRRAAEFEEGVHDEPLYDVEHATVDAPEPS